MSTAWPYETRPNARRRGVRTSRSSFIERSTRWILTAAFFVAQVRCASDSDSHTCGEGKACPAGEVCVIAGDDRHCVAASSAPLPDARYRFVPGRTPIDLLFVLDDTVGSAVAQARLLESLEGLVTDLENPMDPRDVRIAVTTTDMGHPWCDAATADRGRFVASSCLDRLEDFVVPGVDATELCTSRCALDSAALGLPGPLPFEPPTPWLAPAHLPPNVDLRDALACLLPQGISGCRFGSPLGVIDEVFAKMRSNEGGFTRRRDLRGELVPLDVVVLTTLDDCSLGELGEAAFVQRPTIDTPNGRKLWPDPFAEEPPFGVCWNAGTVCERTGPDLGVCQAANRGLSGAHLTRKDGPTVLRPMPPHVEGDPGHLEDDERLSLRVLAGVAEKSDPATSHRTRGQDPDFTELYGVDPACDDGTGVKAVPAVRLSAVADLAISVCSPDYSALFEPSPWPGLSSECVNPCHRTTAACQMRFEHPSGAQSPVPPCLETHKGPALPDDATACVVYTEHACDEPDSMGVRFLRRTPRDEDVFLSPCAPWACSL